jgi:hypothetical protein
MGGEVSDLVALVVACNQGRRHQLAVEAPARDHTTQAKVLACDDLLDSAVAPAEPERSAAPVLRPVENDIPAEPPADEIFRKPTAWHEYSLAHIRDVT